MKPSTSTVALGLLLALSAPCGAAVAADPGEQIMLARAAFWRAQQRPDMAAETLNKVLALNPGQPDALYQLGMLAMQRGDAGGSRNYFDRLRQRAASDPRAAELVGTVSPGAAQPPAPPAAAAQPTAPAVAPANPSPHVAAVLVKPSQPVGAVPAPQPSRDLPELAAVSADSDDLTPITPAARKPAQPGPRALAVNDGQAATSVQVASLPPVTLSDSAAALPDAPSQVRQAGSSDLGIADASVQVAQLELMPPPPVGGYQRPAAAAEYSPTDTLEIDIDRDLSLLEQQSNPSLLAAAGFRWHDGTQGLGQLTEFGAPAEMSFSPWYTGTAKLTVLPVYLDAGTATGINRNFFGTNPVLVAKGLTPLSAGAQNDGGVGLLGGYTYGDFTGQFGTSPLGFPVTNWVGLAAYAPKFLDNQLSIRFAGLRQPVTDSLLSYAGTHTPLSAANGMSNGAFGTSGTWGGVVKSGGNISAFYDDQMYGGYASVEFASVTGTNVASNSELDALLGAYFRPYKTDNDAVRVGVSFYYAGFDKNLSGFTFGQGGYFSPQNLEALTFPVEYTGHNGPWSYLASAAVGVQHFNADSSLVFPNNPNAQAALDNTPGALTVFSGGTSTGVAFNAKGQIEYAFDNSTSLGAAISFNNGNNYDEVIGQVYLRKTFDWLSPIASDPQAIARRDQPQSRL